MVDLKTLAVEAAVSAVAVGSLSVAGLGVAGAATTAPKHPNQGKLALAAKRQALCEVTSRRLAHAESLEARLAAHTSVFVALETKASDRGRTDIAAYWARVVTRRDDDVARRKALLVSLTARDARSHGLVNGTCAPPVAAARPSTPDTRRG